MKRSTVYRSAAGCLLAAVLLAAPAAAQVSFDRYVALGDSLTAAFSSGGLINQVQANSYPALIDRQATGQGGFEQPLVGPPGIPPLLRLVSLSPLVIAPPGMNFGPPLNPFLQRPYDNLAVPGFEVHDVLESPADNPLVELILRPQGFGNASALEQALFLQPTFVSLWIGNNDALAAATSGIVIDGVTLTPVAQFEADYRTIAGAIAASGASLVLATIPNVTAIPFVTTLPPFVLNPATNEPVLVGGQPVPLIGPEGPLAANDFVLLTASQPLSMGIGIPQQLGGTGLPLGTQYVLSASEAATINQRVNAYNQIIRAVAGQVGAALVDINAIYGEIAAEGFELGGLEYTSDFLTGGIFSYDGVHPTSFGYAFVANEFIKAINSTFGASIPLVDLFPFTLEPGPMALPGNLSAAEVKSARFSKAAYESLRRSLGTPKTGTLLRILAEGGGGGGNGGGAGGPGQGPGAGAPQPPQPQPPGGPVAEPPVERPGAGGRPWG